MDDGSLRSQQATGRILTLVTSKRSRRLPTGLPPSRSIGLHVLPSDDGFDSLIAAMLASAVHLGLRMRPSPSIVPPGDERDVYLVLDDFGRLGHSWVEADENDTSRESVIRDLLTYRYNNPVRVIVFNTDEGTSRDVSAEIAHELIERTADLTDGLPECLSNFVDRHGAGLRRPVQLSLPIRFEP